MAEEHFRRQDYLDEIRRQDYSLERSVHPPGDISQCVSSVISECNRSIEDSLQISQADDEFNRFSTTDLLEREYNKFVETRQSDVKRSILCSFHIVKQMSLFQISNLLMAISRSVAEHTLWRSILEYCCFLLNPKNKAYLTWLSPNNEETRWETYDTKVTMMQDFLKKVYQEDPPALNNLRFLSECAHQLGNWRLLKFLGDSIAQSEHQDQHQVFQFAYLAEVSSASNFTQQNNATLFPGELSRATSASDRVRNELDQALRVVQRSQQRFELASINTPRHEQLVRSLDLRSEADRFKTFENWPGDTRTVCPVFLSSFGFLYLGNLDRVQCFSCGGVLRNWNYGDNVDTVHRQHFPHCRMIEGTDNTNVPLTSDERISLQYPNSVQEPPVPREFEQRDCMRMFQCLYPVSPHMRSEHNRFKTFDHRWAYDSNYLTTERVAEAGFFFVGVRDRVKCWYCNGGLQNWRLYDDPWEEHAKWFPTCEFVLQVMGPKYVQRLVQMYPNIQRPLIRVPLNARGDIYSLPPTTEPTVEEQSIENQVDEAMNCYIVRVAQGMGFGLELIRKTARIKLQQDGTMYALIDDFIEDLSSEDHTGMPSTNNSQPTALTRQGGTDARPNLFNNDEQPGYSGATDACPDLFNNDQQPGYSGATDARPDLFNNDQQPGYSGATDDRPDLFNNDQQPGYSGATDARPDLFNNDQQPGYSGGTNARPNLFNNDEQPGYSDGTDARPNLFNNDQQPGYSGATDDRPDLFNNDEQPGYSGGTDDRPDLFNNDQQPGYSGATDDRPDLFNNDEQPGYSGGTDARPNLFNNDQQPGYSGATDARPDLFNNDQQPGGAGTQRPHYPLVDDDMQLDEDTSVSHLGHYTKVVAGDPKTRHQHANEETPVKHEPSQGNGNTFNTSKVEKVVADECVVCCDERVQIYLMPCKHQFCFSCYMKVKKCPLCRSNITDTKEIFD